MLSIPMTRESSFNSSLVRLRVEKTADNLLDIVMFQFQFGAIKSYFIHKLFFKYQMFQFQFGAIKSSTLSSESNQFRMFQFQFGAIKSKIHETINI